MLVRRQYPYRNSRPSPSPEVAVQFKKVILLHSTPSTKYHVQDDVVNNVDSDV